MNRRTLFDQIVINRLTLPNRFMRSATWEGMCDTEGNPTPRLGSLYGDLVAGGVGLVVTGYTVVHPLGRQMMGTMGACRDEQVPGLRALADCVHKAGGRLFAQLVHAGAQTSMRVIGRTPHAPSAVESPFYSGIPKAMDEREILDVIESFGQAARRVKEAGFDGVQFHGAHGYLINQFLSPLTNRREDAFGGSLENRFRFLEEAYRVVRGNVGADYPVTIKLTASDNFPGGIDAQEAAWTARRLQDLGIDAIEVSAGTAGSGEGVPVRKGILTREREAYNAALARRIRREVSVPLALVGGLRSLEVIRALFDEGVADMFSLSRPLIREPGLINQWRTNPAHRSTCVSCNLCFRPGMREGGIYCVPEKKKQERVIQTQTQT